MMLTIGENIKCLRKARSMTQEQLAEALGVTVGAVYKWENRITMPEIRLLVELSDLFGVSVDALLGYRVQNNTAAALAERIHALQRAKDFQTAAVEAEKALSCYPNDFSIVYRCGEMYRLKGVEGSDSPALRRAIELLSHAMLLLSQNTEPEINEYTIQSGIAQCYISLDEQEHGLDLLKKYNAGGIHNALIGLTCAASPDRSPEEAAPFLMKAFDACIGELVQTMTGYATYYDRTGNSTAALDALLWLIRYLESLKTDETGVSYVDKILAPYYSECANLARKLGREEDAQSYLRVALNLARRFDAAPVHNLLGTKFRIGETKDATAYDDMGATAMDAIENQMREGSWDDTLRALWTRIKEETAPE